MTAFAGIEGTHGSHFFVRKGKVEDVHVALHASRFGCLREDDGSVLVFKAKDDLAGIFAVGFSNLSNGRFAEELRVALTERCPGFKIYIVFGHDGSDFFLLVIRVEFDLVDRRYRVKTGVRRNSKSSASCC